jgi:hypothetical protein
MPTPVDYDFEQRLAKYRLTWQRIAARVFAEDEDSPAQEAPNDEEEGYNHAQGKTPAGR